MLRSIASGLSTLLLLLITLNASPQCYELVWAEEFDKPGLPDPAYWTFEEGGGGWGNNELQYYTVEDTDNARIEDGRLIITALEESLGGRNYTSARLITQDKFSVQYGRIEARMKLPYTQGIWPAFWMLGSSFSEVGWPACGEIDIMELVGGEDSWSTVHGTVHWDNNGSYASFGRSYTLSSGRFADDYYVFSIEWDDTSIRWFVNGTQYNVIDITPSALSEFRDDFFILLNLAVGGNWPGSPDATSVFPQTMEVDYVRVYKRSEEIADLSISGDTVVPQLGPGKQYSLPFSPDWSYEWQVTGNAAITSGNGTQSIIVDLGCDTDTLTCTVNGTCDTYTFSKIISIEEEISGPMFAADNETGLVFTIDEMANTTYSWSVPADAMIVSGQDNDTLVVDWGTTYEPVLLEFSNSCGTTQLEYPVTIFGQYPYPDIYAPHAIPGTIEAVDFDYGGEDLGYHDATNGNEGTGPRQDTNVDTEFGDNGSPNVGWITSGEWLEYTVNVETDTVYRLDMRVATNNGSGGPFSIYFNGEKKLDSITVSNTGGWSSFTTINAGAIRLSSADTLMRVSFDTGGFNLGKMTFTPTEPTDVREQVTDETFSLYPNPVADHFMIEGMEQIRELKVIGVDGRSMFVIRNLSEGRSRIEADLLPSGIYIVKLIPESGIPWTTRMLKR